MNPLITQAIEELEKMKVTLKFKPATDGYKDRQDNGWAYNKAVDDIQAKLPEIIEKLAEGVRFELYGVFTEMMNGRGVAFMSRHEEVSKIVEAVLLGLPQRDH